MAFSSSPDVPGSGPHRPSTPLPIRDDGTAGRGIDRPAFRAPGSFQDSPSATSVSPADFAEVMARSGMTVTRARRDRRGRGIRGLKYPPFHPLYRTRKELFDEAVVTYVARLEMTWGRELRGTEFAVEEVPPSDPSPWERDGITLGRYFPAVSGQPSRIVIYRRPVEARAEGREELAAIIRDVIVDNIAFMLSKAPHEIDGDYQS